MQPEFKGSLFDVLHNGDRPTVIWGYLKGPRTVNFLQRFELARHLPIVLLLHRDLWVPSIHP